MGSKQNPVGHHWCVQQSRRSDPPLRQKRFCQWNRARTTLLSLTREVIILSSTVSKFDNKIISFVKRKRTTRADSPETWEKFSTLQFQSCDEDHVNNQIIIKSALFIFYSWPNKNIIYFILVFAFPVVHQYTLKFQSTFTLKSML